MRRWAGVVLLAAALGAAVPAAAQQSWVLGTVQFEGVVTAIQPAVGALTVQVTKNGSGPATVLIQRATTLRAYAEGSAIERDNSKGETHIIHPSTRVSVPATIADFRDGDRVAVEGFRLDASRVVALTVDVLSRTITVPQPWVPGGLAVQGIVVGRSRASLTVADSSGSARVVRAAPATQVTGQRSSFGAIALGDVVQVQGVATADGTVAAQQIDVVSVNGYQVSGRITAKSPGLPRYLVLDNRLSVGVGPEAQILSGSQPRSFADLQLGQTVTVVGTPVTVGGLVVGVNARVITY